MEIRHVFGAESFGAMGVMVPETASRGWDRNGVCDKGCV